METTSLPIQSHEVKHTPRFIATSFLCLLLCTSCYSPQPSPVATRYGADNRLPDTVSYWNGDHMTGSPSVRISLSQQRAYFYKGNQLVGVSKISSGSEGLDTVTGSFRILEKDRHHASSLFGNYVDANGVIIQKDVDTSKDPKPPGAIYDGASMPYWMRIVGGTGMHEGFLPGYADSHGCIRMPSFMAERFFHSVKVGTPVSIEP